MKQTFRLLLAALTIVLGLASCATNDLPVDPDVLVKEMSGMWWSLTDQEGTYKDAADSYPYTRMGQAICFNEDGTGYGVTFFFNDEQGDPIAIIGGEWMAPFTYSVKGDGSIKMNFDKAYKEYADYFKKWTMTYGNETVTATNGTLTLTLEKPSDAMAVLIHDWDQQFNGGLTPTNFNANTDFTASTWRSEKWIYIYDGVGDDHPTKNGFTIVALPWNTEDSEGTLQTNLPDGFCNDITPENGWELALNLCGKSTGGVKNNNFFALYNKYLGILRFFFFMPADFASGNDHVWQVSLGDNLAQHSLYGYGVPSDRTITNKAAIGQTGADTYMEYVTPWVDYKSSDGLIVPNAGWWAFDVDLSMYRANANHDTKSNIKLQMRSWDKHTTSLYSAMTANIDGTLKASLKLDAVTKKSSSSAKGVLMGLQAAAQAGSSIINLISGNWTGALTSAGQMFGTGASLAGLGKDGGTAGYTGSLDGTFNLGLDGSINTDGVISGSKTITGIPSPTLSLKDFDLKNSHVGQGVWNLKTPPVVYVTQIYIELWTSYIVDFFDPNSIEIQLNPNVFPESQVEWIKVEALCTAKESKLNDDETRRAYGLGSADMEKSENSDIYNNRINIKWNTDIDYKLSGDNGYEHTAYTDFLYASDDKMGFELKTSESDPHSFGRCKDGLWIEPGVRDWKYCRMPFLEVNVTVRVKMKGMDTPILLSRNYLPEYKNYDYGWGMEQAIQKASAYKHTELYNYQMKRIDDLLALFGVHSHKDYNYIPLRGSRCDEMGSEGYDKLFDGKKETKWCTDKYYMKDGKWFVEFMSKQPINVTSYCLTTGNDTKYNPSRNPKSWKVYGKLNEGDQWTLLDSRTNGNLPADNYKEAWFSCSHKKCQYFRFEVSEIVSNDYMQLSEFAFNAK